MDDFDNISMTAALWVLKKIHGGCQKVGPKVARFLDR